MKATHILVPISNVTENNQGFMKIATGYRYKKVNVSEHNTNIHTLVKSCQEALNDEWDRSDEGIQDMITLLERTLI